MSASQPLICLYDLSLRMLDEQERRAEALRGRLGPVVAAAALGVALLSGPLVGATRPLTVAGKVSLAAAIGGLLLTVAATCRLLSLRDRDSRELTPARIAIEVAHGPLADEVTFYTTMIIRLGDQASLRSDALARLTRGLTAMLCGILVMLCGLALAALVG